jgi:hypothetical protein
VAISALTGEGLPDLLQTVGAQLYETYSPVIVRLPYQQGGLISLFHDAGQVERIENERGGVVIHGKLPGRLLARFQPYSYFQRTPTQATNNSDPNVAGGWKSALNADDPSIASSAEETEDQDFEDQLYADLWDEDEIDEGYDGTGEDEI